MVKTIHTNTDINNYEMLKTHYSVVFQLTIEFYVILLSFCKEIPSSNRHLQVYIPLTWLQVRKRFGIPINVKYLTLLQFSNWTSDWSNENSWEYLKMANYEIPLYNTNLHCPNPCARPNVCHNDLNSNGLCMIMPNEEVLNTIPINMRVKLGSVYAYDYECVCIDQYVFNHTLKKCVPIRRYCDSSVCFNDGECEYLSEEEQIIPGIEFACKCPPAWKGLACEEPRNPCLEIQGLCGQHYCYRDPTNLKYGYRCQCPIGYRAISWGKPQCVNINECLEYTHDICLNGGICIDKDPSYSTTDYNECSISCGIGLHKRFRNCTLPNRCIRSYIQISKCYGYGLFCENTNIEESFQSGSKIIQNFNYQWSIQELLIIYSIIFMIPICLPICLVIYSFIKISQFVFYKIRISCKQRV
ncbi:Cadherin tumor suppressor [Schistosoma japonicum]|nr:Cadherin tumor suppressor [Schistosoma japonicum]